MTLGNPLVRVGFAGRWSASRSTPALGWTPAQTLELDQRELVFTLCLALQGGGGAPAMCDKCQELEKKIERYRRLAFSINDRLTIDRINQLIKETEAEKVKLHPDQQR